MGKNKMSFVIRKSTKNDSKEILKLIQELADYEKMPNGPKLTEKDLEEHGYNGPRPFFECLVAFEPSKPDVLIGFVLFFYTYSTWDGPSVFMEDLYVTPASRGQGLGTKLWQGVVQDVTGTVLIGTNPPLNFTNLKEPLICLKLKDG